MRLAAPRVAADSTTAQLPQVAKPRPRGYNSEGDQLTWNQTVWRLQETAGGT